MSDASPDLLAEYDAFERDGGVASVERDVVTVTGPDAGRYLQGQLSQDVVAMVGPSAWSLLLQPNGKVDAWLRVHRRSDNEYVLDVDAGFGEVVVARLQRFLLRTKAEIGTPTPEQLHAARFPAARVVVGDEAAGHPPLDGVGGPVVGPGVAGSDTLRQAGSDRPGEAGSDTLGEPGTVTGRTTQVPALADMSAETLERYRIAHGVPAMGAEITADTIPAELGQWLIDASVSFTKGCYTGQELVARIDSRGGNVPRPVRLLHIDGEATSVIGGEVRHGDKIVGAVTSATPYLAPHQPALALAPLARSVEIGTTVEVRTEGGAATATVVEPPFVGHGIG